MGYNFMKTMDISPRKNIVKLDLCSPTWLTIAIDVPNSHWLVDEWIGGTIYSYNYLVGGLEHLFFHSVGNNNPI